MTLESKKILLILRHAKSSWKDINIPDKERPLNKRGRNQGLKMGSLLKDLNNLPDYIIRSDAKRAVETSELVVKSSEYNGQMNTNSSLYDQNSADQYIKVLAQTPNNYSKVLIIGHNPSVENIIEKLTDKIETMKTCSLAKIDLNIKDWKDIQNSYHNELTNIWHPNFREE